MKFTNKFACAYVVFSIHAMYLVNLNLPDLIIFIQLCKIHNP